ncbi:MAG: CHAT domain-containing protein, partial [Acidobacteriota bacterium]|nr:CHAT domain-containing protein [Acidobacteriota bacterium]
RAFLDSLELSKVNISQGVDFKLQNQEKELMNDISSLYSKLLAAELSPDEKNTIQAEMTEKDGQLESLKREIRLKSPSYANLKYPEIITLEDAQKLLGPKTSFFTYCISTEKSLGFALTQETLKIFPVPPKDKLQKMVKQHLMEISDKDNQNFSTGSELFRRLVQPGLEKNIKNIIFIPDDILHILPFETLLQGKTGRWLLEDYRIAYAPSISSLREITARKKSNGKKRPMDILAFGDPYFGSSETEGNGEDIFKSFYRLNYSGVEIERIQSLFKNKKSHLFVRERASEDRLKSHPLSNYKIIHFATHSIIDDKTPSRSSILLSQDSEHVEDGMLQMREIYNLNLNCDLVTLSACETGLGQFIKGEGIEGLNRSFFYAGTSSVLMSLWAVNDQATYQLMERFYTHLRSSYSIMDALREAKLEMLSSHTPLSHPYYWAGFIVSGKADEVVFPKASKKWILLSIPFLLICGAILISIRKKNGKSGFKTLI